MTSSTSIAWITTSRGSRGTSRPSPRQLVEPPALVVDGREHRRHLLDPADEAGGPPPRPARGPRGGTAGVESTRPLRSRVSVVTPSRSVATYSLSWSVRYGMSLVASPSSIGSTPMASGSSVPACPTRSKPSRRRSSATTSNDVTPGGLSTTSTPASLMAGSGSTPAPRRARVVHRGQDLARHRRQRARHRAAGGVGMSAAAEARGDAVHVDVALAAQAHLHRCRRARAGGRRRARRRSSAGSSRAPRPR